MADEPEQTDDSNQTSPNGEDGSADTGEGRDVVPQDQVNTIVQERVERARQKERERFNEQLQEAGFEGLDEVKETKEQLEEKREEELREKEQYKELFEKKREEFEQKVSELQQRNQELESRFREQRVERELLDAAQRNEAVSPHQVARLLRGNVSLDDDGQPVVVDDEGNTQLGDDGNPMRPADLVDDFLDDNPHFKQAADGRGAQGTPNDGGEPAGSEGYDPSKKTDPDHLLEHEDEIAEKVESGELSM